jgi:hypothetical protein
MDAPFTRILRNSNWRNATHLGTDYAALLVDPAYRPPANVQSLPPVGGPVAAVAVTKGATVSPSTTLQFSGYEWRVRTAASNRGGRSNPYSASNAFTDERGALHLRIAKKGDRFECAEIAMTRSLGYGTYSFLVHDVSRLAQDVTFEMFTWDYSGTDQNNREMDVVIRRPAPTGKLSARFVVQPFHVSSNVHEFKVPGVALRHSFRWEAGRIAFSTSRPDDPKHAIAEHIFTLGTPTPGVESARIALYLPNSASSHPAEAEVVVERFEYTP